MPGMVPEGTHVTWPDTPAWSGHIGCTAAAPGSRRLRGHHGPPLRAGDDLALATCTSLQRDGEADATLGVLRSTSEVKDDSRAANSKSVSSRCSCLMLILYL